MYVHYVVGTSSAFERYKIFRFTAVFSTLYPASVKIIRVCGERDRALMFRAWSRLCLHAASLSAAEGASASATAVARAARAEAIEKKAVAAAEKAEAWSRAAAASAEVAEEREKAQREAARGSDLTAELQQRKEEMEQVARQQQLRRIKMLVRSCHANKRTSQKFGW